MKRLPVACSIAAATVCGSFAAWQTLHRRSSLVQRWRPTSFEARRAGPLGVFDSGPVDGAVEAPVVLLHGLGATSDYFGAFYDVLGRTRRVVIIDLLGFGGSLDESRSSFGVDDHVGALDEAFEELGLGETSIVLAAHSMGSAVALTWADRNRERAHHVYLWGPPVYPNASAASSMAQHYGPMGQLFVLDTAVAKRACRISCRNRRASGQIMSLLAPRWPTTVSSKAALHTWPAYRQSIHSLIDEFDWRHVLPGNVPLTIFHGEADAIGDQPYLTELVGASHIVTVPGADHHVALQRPDLLIDAVENQSVGSPT